MLSAGTPVLDPGSSSTRFTRRSGRAWFIDGSAARIRHTSRIKWEPGWYALSARYLVKSAGERSERRSCCYQTTIGFCLVGCAVQVTLCKANALPS